MTIHALFNDHSPSFTWTYSIAYGIVFPQYIQMKSVGLGEFLHELVTFCVYLGPSGAAIDSDVVNVPFCTLIKSSLPCPMWNCFVIWALRYRKTIRSQYSMCWAVAIAPPGNHVGCLQVCWTWQHIDYSATLTVISRKHELYSMQCTAYVQVDEHSKEYGIRVMSQTLDIVSFCRRLAMP